MIAQTPVRVLCGTIARCKTPFSNRVLLAVPPRSLQSYKDSKSLGKKGYSEIMSENESKSKCDITKAEFCPAEVLFPGQTDDITKFLRYYAVSVDIYYYSAVVLRMKSIITHRKVFPDFFVASLSM